MEDLQEIKRFQTIYVVQPSSHDFSALKKYTDNIVFLSTGYEELEDLPLIIRENLRDFCADTDAIVPAGKIIWSFMAGLVLSNEKCSLTLGIFTDKDYVFEEVECPENFLTQV